MIMEKWNELKRWLENGIRYLDELKSRYQDFERELDRLEFKQAIYRDIKQKMDYLDSIFD